MLYYDEDDNTIEGFIESTSPDTDDVEDKGINDGAIRDWLKITHQNKVVKEADPFHLDMYRFKMSKHPPFNKRLIALASDNKNLIVENPRFTKIRMLEDRLRHIEEMKQTLKEKIAQLQNIKLQEKSAKMKIENEVTKAEKEWKSDIERFNPGSYRPLIRLGDISHLL